MCWYQTLETTHECHYSCGFLWTQNSSLELFCKGETSALHISEWFPLQLCSAKGVVTGNVFWIWRFSHFLSGSHLSCVLVPDVRRSSVGVLCRGKASALHIFCVVPTSVVCFSKGVVTCDVFWVRRFSHFLGGYHLNCVLVQNAQDSTRIVGPTWISLDSMQFTGSAIEEFDPLSSYFQGVSDFYFPCGYTRVEMWMVLYL